MLTAYFVCGVSAVAFAQYQKGGGTSSSSTSSKAGAAGAADSASAKPGTVLPSGVIVATPITKEEATKKYPPPGSGKYPTGDRPYSHTPGHILSPYPPHKEFDCTNIGRGDLVLDPYAKKVFVRP